MKSMVCELRAIYITVCKHCGSGNNNNNLAGNASASSNLDKAD